MLITGRRCLNDSQDFYHCSRRAGLASPPTERMVATSLEESDVNAARKVGAATRSELRDPDKASEDESRDRYRARTGSDTHRNVSKESGVPYVYWCNPHIQE